MKIVTKKLSAILSLVLVVCLVFAVSACAGGPAPTCVGHKDADRNGKCDLCTETMEVPTLPSCAGHKDIDANAKCDICEEAMFVEPAPSADPADLYILKDATTATKQTLTLSINAKAEYVGTLAYTYQVPKKDSEGNDTAVMEEKTGFTTVTWKENVDFPTYEISRFIVYVKASEDAKVTAQKVLVDVDLDVEGYSCTISIADEDKVLSVDKVEKPVLASENGAGEKKELVFFEDGLAALKCQGLMGASSTEYGTWKSNLLGFTADVGSNSFTITKGKTKDNSADWYYAAPSATSIVKETLYHDADVVVLRGVGQSATASMTAGFIVQGATADVVASLFVNTRTNKAEITIDWTINAFGMKMMNFSMITANAKTGPTTALIGYGDVTAVSDQANTYTASFAYKVADVDETQNPTGTFTDYTTVITYTVTDGVYTATLAVLESDFSNLDVVGYVGMQYDTNAIVITNEQA